MGNKKSKNQVTNSEPNPPDDTITTFGKEPCILLVDGYLRHIQQSLNNIIPTSINQICFNFYHILMKKSKLEWKDKSYSRCADQYLHASNENQMIRAGQTSPSSYNSTYIGDLDYVIVRTKYMLEINQRMIINCYMKQVGDEMWIGPMLTCKYKDNISLRLNRGAITYCAAGSIDYFGNRYNNVPQYQSGDWITFDIFLATKRNETILRVFKNGQFVVDMSEYIQCRIKKRDQFYFVVELDAANDCVYGEKMFVCHHCKDSEYVNDIINNIHYLKHSKNKNEAIII
eukprot:476466_1